WRKTVERRGDPVLAFRDDVDPELTVCFGQLLDNFGARPIEHGNQRAAESNGAVLCRNEAMNGSGLTCAVYGSELTCVDVRRNAHCHAQERCDAKHQSDHCRPRRPELSRTSDAPARTENARRVGIFHGLLLTRHFGHTQLTTRSSCRSSSISPQQRSGTSTASTEICRHTATSAPVS